MDGKRTNSDIHSASHIMALIALTVFSVVIITLNRVLDWELWMIPVIAVGPILCVCMHIYARLADMAKTYIYGFFLILELFYYAVKIPTVYDSSSAVIVIILIFSVSGERPLAIAGAVCGMAGMVFHLFMASDEGGAVFELSGVIRTTWHFAVIVLAAILTDRIAAVWRTTERKYIDRIEAVEEENARANNFLANVSHEIRTPINAVMGLASVMEKEELPAGVRKNIDAIADAGHRIADQVGDILDFTETDMRKLSVTNENYMISSLVNDLISQLRYTEDYGLDLIIDLSPGVPAELIGDAVKIKKIMQHLITNGFKFTNSGGVYAGITARKRDYGVNLIIEISDTGVGMTEEEVERIYEKFYQVDSGRTRTAGGLGLGIPIVSGFARAMGGFLSIESTPGFGTTVHVSIPQEIGDSSPCISVTNRENTFIAGFLGFTTTEEPRVREYYIQVISHLVSGLDLSFHRVQSREELEKLAGSCEITHLFVGTGEYRVHKDYIDSLARRMNVALVEDRDFSGSVSPEITLIPKPFYGGQIASFIDRAHDDAVNSENGSMSCPGVKALVVDDEPMNLMVARGILETYGMTVTTAASGMEAVQLCGSEDFGIIFMDHMMPGMDGVEAMKRLRLNASKVHKDLCVVALTANAISSAREMFLSEGFDGFVAKPIDLTELERVLKRVLPRSVIVYDTDPVQPALPAAEAPERTRSAENAPSPADDPYAPMRALGVNIGNGLIYSRNDDGFYRELIAEYAKNSVSKLNELETYYAGKDLKDYATRVHAIKSTSKMIGAAELSETARRLEAAAKAGDSGTVDTLHPGFISGYGALMRAILAVTGGTEGMGEPGGSDAVLEFFPDGGDEDGGGILEFAPGGDGE